MGMSVLHFAAMNRKPNNTEMIKILLENDINVNSIASDNTIPLDYACATGININSIVDLNTYYFDQKLLSPGNPEMIQLLLDFGAGVYVNLKDSAGDTPIIYAAYGTGEGSQEF